MYTILFICRTTYRIGFATTECIISSARRTPTHTTQTEASSSHTSVGWCNANTLMSTEKAKLSICPTSTMIHWWSFTPSEYLHDNIHLRNYRAKTVVSPHVLRGHQIRRIHLKAWLRGNMPPFIANKYINNNWRGKHLKINFPWLNV